MTVWLSVLLPAAGAVSPAAIEESLAAYAAAVCDAEAVDVSWLGLSQDLPGTDDAQLDWRGDPCRGRPELRLRIVEHGALLSQVPVRPGLDVWVRAPVAPRRLSPGEDFSPRPGLVLAQDLRGTAVGEGTWRSRVSLREGQAVTTAAVIRVPDVERGSDVTLTIVRGSLRIEAPGRLAEHGYVGERVRVVNEATQVVAEGVLVAPDSVRIL